MKSKGLTLGEGDYFDGISGRIHGQVSEKNTEKLSGIARVSRISRRILEKHKSWGNF